MDFFGRQINVAIVEGNSFSLRMLECIFQAQLDMQILGICKTAAAALQWLQTNEPDILIVDIVLPDASGITVIEYCNALYPSCRVMVLTASDSDQDVMQSFHAGASGYVLKKDNFVNIGHAVRALWEGGSPISPTVARRMLSNLVAPADECLISGKADDRPVSDLSVREAQVLDLISKGYTYGKAALILEMSKNTLQTHIKKIYEKLAVHSKIDAINVARQRGFI